MNISEKITILRKQRGYSQEELASLLNVSRQAVSKWELGDSTPDLDRIIRLAELFQVSTDMLLREDQSIEPDVSQARLSDAQAQAFIDTRLSCAPWMALGIALCILSPIALIVLSGGFEMGWFRGLFPSEDAAATLGIIILLAIVVIAVGMIVLSGIRMGKYEWMESNPVIISHGIYKKARQSLDEGNRQYLILVTAGICLCILSVIPMFALMLISETLVPFGVGILLAIVSVAAPMIVYASLVRETWLLLLQEGDYTPERKSVRKKYGWVPGVYWCLVTALYLVVSFLYDSWKISWLIYAAFGIIYGALVIFLHRRTLNERSED